mgnify:CR=1 FL=1
MIESARHAAVARNLDALLPHVAATFPRAPKVVIGGGSAGGFGTMLGYHQFRAYFPAQRLDTALVGRQRLLHFREARSLEEIARRTGQAVRFDLIGEGEDAPVADNTTAAGRAKNRRVEIVVAN